MMMMEAVLALVAIMAISYQRFGEFTNRYSRRGKIVTAISVPIGVVLVCIGIGVGVGVTAGRNTGRVSNSAEVCLYVLFTIFSI